MKPLYSLFTRSALLYRWRTLFYSFSNLFQRLLFSLESYTALGLFASSSCALLAHKSTLILLHRPLGLEFIVFWPFLFGFDLATLLLLYHALASSSRVWRIAGYIICVVIISCSATFVSVFLETNTAANWGRSIEIISNWNTYGKLMMEGGGNTLAALIAFLTAGGTVVMARRFQRGQCKYENLSDEIIPKTRPLTLRILLRNLINTPFVPLTLSLIFCGLFLPSQSLRQMTSTLLLDIIGNIISVFVSKTVRHMFSAPTPSANHASNPLGNLNYNPWEDPYYISNLDSPIDEFIAEALDGVKIQNIVHIVLESVRADCFPFREQSPFVDYIKENFRPHKNGSAITTANVTPFIDSLAQHTLSWETMWTIVPFTHKSLLGRIDPIFYCLTGLDYCGVLGLPIDWTVEMEEPAKLYQHCLPQVLRHLNSITDTWDETVSIMNSNAPAVTDIWDLTHISTNKGQYDHERELLEAFGFNSVITSEDIGRLLPDHPPVDFPLGYYDDRGMEYFWRYVDHAIQRKPRNRMYLSWMSSTTHTPFLFSDEWLDEHYQPFVRDRSKWGSTDKWLNALRWTDDKIKEIILGFRERGLEDDTLFLIHSDHGFPFIGEEKSPVENIHSEPLQIPWMIYNPRIQNPSKKKVEGSFYSLSLPTTILDLMIHTDSFLLTTQDDLARRFAQNYEFAQSLLRPVKETLRMFLVSPGGTQWAVDNSHNLRCVFHLDDDYVQLVDYVSDPNEEHPMVSWNGIEGLISYGAEERFGEGTEKFLREAFQKQDFMKKELLRRYGLSN